MNQWGKLLNLMAAHTVLSAKRDAFLAALRAYLAEYFPERVALVDDVASCEPNEYFVLNRMVGALMMPMESADRRFCIQLINRLFLVDFDDLKQRHCDGESVTLRREDFSAEASELFGFFGEIYFDNFLVHNPKVVLDFLEKHQEYLDEALLIDTLDQVVISTAYQGKTQQHLEQIQRIEQRLFERLGWVEFPEKGQPDTIFLFISVIIWNDSQISHAPTHILNHWIQLLQPYFKRIVVCYELPFGIAQPALSYYSLNFSLPCPPPDQVEFLGFPKALSVDMLKQSFSALGMGYDTPMMILGGNQKVSTRFRLRNSYFYPMIQMPLLHSARVSFYYSVTGSGTLAQHNIFGETLEFIEASEGLAEKEAQTVILPQDYLSQNIPDLSAGALKIIMVGYQLVSEISFNQNELLMLFGKLAEKRALEVHCIGLCSKQFATLNLPELYNVELFPHDPTPLLRQKILDIKPHFYLNPKRIGGGYGAYLALHLGIPVLSYAVGDVGSMMSLLYCMNEPEDFVEFIQNYLENADFRATINEVHRHFFARSFLSKSDCCRLLIRKMREIDACLQG